MKRYMAALGGAVLATFLAAGAALAADPLGSAGSLVQPIVGILGTTSSSDGAGAPCCQHPVDGKSDGTSASSGNASGGDVEQEASQSNTTDQTTKATASPIQVGGVNLAIDVLSSGETEQSNSNENEATASSSNRTIQAIGQQQEARGGDATSGDAAAADAGGDGTSCGCEPHGKQAGDKDPRHADGTSASSGNASGGDVEQEARQSNTTDQTTKATASPIQVGGVNLAIPLPFHDRGKSGCGCPASGFDRGHGSSAEAGQANANENEASARTSNSTVQLASQWQDARGGDATSGAAFAGGWPAG